MHSYKRRGFQAIAGVLTALVMLASSLTAMAPTALAAANPILTAENISGVAGATVQLPITLTSSGEVAGVQFDLKYDHAQLTYQPSVASGNLTGPPDFTVGSNVVDGNIRVIIFSLTGALIPAGAGTVAQVQFQVAAGAQPGQSSALELLSVTVSDNNGAKLTTTVNNGQFSVPGILVTGVSLNKHSDNLTAGQTDQLVATISPANATNQNVTWASDNTSVATVSNAGLVTAVAEGTATVTVTTADGGFQDTCAVKVTAPVVGATPTITWATPSAITYGTALSGTQLNAAASYNGNPVAGTFVYSPAPGAVLPVGTQLLSVTFNPTDNVSYTSAGGSVQVLVNPAVLTVKADNKNMTAGQAVPALTYTVTGFVNGETAAVLSGAPILTTSANSSSEPGSYPIEIAQGTLAAANYTLSFVGGTLTVYGTTLYVDDSGGADFTTIQAAVDAAGAGTTIIVRNGAYPENVTVGKLLTIKSESGPAGVTVNPASGNVFTVTADNVTIDGVTITQSNTSTAYGINIPSGTVSYCVFQNNIISNIGSGIYVTTSGSNPDIFKPPTYKITGYNNILNNTISLSSGGTYGIFVDLSNYNIISGNTINDPYNRATTIGICLSKSGNPNSACMYNKVSGNTITGTGYGFKSIGNTSRTLYIETNTYYQNTMMGVTVAPVLSTVSRNNTWNSPAQVTYSYNGTQLTGYMGNYWGKYYTGTDANNDGIGDTGYSVGEGTDGYPLMYPAASYTAAPPAPTAGFGSDVQSGEAGFSVKFNSEMSTGSAPLLYTWDFGDGETSTLASPTHQYNAQPSYPAHLTVSLTVANYLGSNSTMTKAGYITVLQPIMPQADFLSNVTSGIAGFSVGFVNMTTIGSPPLTYAWTFGDGGTSTDKNPIHQYNVSGNFTVSLTVTNQAGSNTVTKPDYISVAPPILPVPAFAANPTSGIAGFSVAFTDQTAIGSPPILGYAWDFGDGGTSTAENPTHQYTVSGNYTVSFTVTNLAGSNTTTKPGYISVAPPIMPVADFSASPRSGVRTLTVAFTDTTATGSPPLTYAWDFTSDGTVDSTVQNPSYTYTAPGIYTVSFTVSNLAGNNTATKTGYINVRASGAWYVDAAGSGDTTKIQAAVNQAQAGDTIIVKAGNYPENVSINKSLILRSEVPQGAVVNPASGNIFAVSASGVTIDGFNINESAAATGYGIYSTGGQSNCVFQNNAISNVKYGLYLTGAGTSNTIAGNTISVSTASSSVCVYLSSSKNNIIRGNTISARVYGMRFSSSTGNILYGNSFTPVAGVNVYASSNAGNNWSSPTPVTYRYNGAWYTSRVGNYWGLAYTGTDGNGDGIGDTPFNVVSTDNDSYPLMATVNPFQLITATASNWGTINPGTVLVPQGDNQTFTVAPANGCHLVDVLVDGGSVLGQLLNNTYTFDNVTASHTIAATFVPDVTVSLDAPAHVLTDADFTVSVDITAVNHLKASNYTVTFDAAKLRLDSVTDGMIGTTPVPVMAYNSPAPGTVIVVNSLPLGTDVSGEGSLAVLHFHALGAIGPGTPINISDGTLANNLAQEIPALWQGDTVASRLAQTITFDPIEDKGYASPDFTVSASASSGLPVTFTASGNCTITGNVVHITGIGTCTITAHQAGDADYEPAPDVSRTFQVLLLAGDANGDGKVNALDLTKTARIIVGLDPVTAGADANGDGKVNALDIAQVELTILNTP